MALACVVRPDGDDDAAECDGNKCDGVRDNGAFYLCTAQMFVTMAKCGSLLVGIAALVLTNSSDADKIADLIGDAPECLDATFEWAACHGELYGTHAVRCQGFAFGDGKPGNAEIRCSNGHAWSAATDSPWNCNDEDYGVFCNNRSSADDGPINVADPTESAGGSCANLCGQTAAECACDAECASYGDCCADYLAQCGA